MNHFSSDRFSGIKTVEERRCRCGAQFKLARTMMDSTRGLTVRMFECNCGERSWSETRD
jgi:hypothetical protein